MVYKLIFENIIPLITHLHYSYFSNHLTRVLLACMLLTSNLNLVLTRSTHAFFTFSFCVIMPHLELVSSQIWVECAFGEIDDRWGIFGNPWKGTL